MTSIYTRLVGYILMAATAIISVRFIMVSKKAPEFQALLSPRESAVKKCPRKFHDMETLFDYLEGKVAKPCRNMREIGGQLVNGVKDGQKMVCFDHEYQLMEGRCIVMSFGISDDWSFDDVMASLGCEVYAFDPTLEMGNFTRSKGVTFWNIGVSGKDGYIIINGQYCQVLSYKRILDILGLLHQRISYLKIDIEESEFSTFQNILDETPELLDNVSQIGVEFHPGIYQGNGSVPSSGRFPELIRIIEGLECLGYELRSSHMNELPHTHYHWNKRKESCCYEVFWTKRSK